MKTRIYIILGFVLSGAFFVACGNGGGGSSNPVAAACPAGYIASTTPYQQYPGVYQQYPGQYPTQYQGQYPGQYPTQYPGQYPTQYPTQYPGQYPYPNGTTVPANCVLATGSQAGIPYPGGVPGGGIVVPPPSDGAIGTVPAGVRIGGYISTTNQDQFNLFLKENSNQCNTGWNYWGTSECNNYTSAGYIELTGNGSTVSGLVYAGPYNGIGTDGGYMSVSAAFTYYVVNNKAGFELRVQGASYGYGGGMLSVRADTGVINGNSVDVVISYKGMRQSTLTEFGRATISLNQ